MIQADTIHAIRDGDDDLIISTTVGNKVKAEFLPLLSQILNEPSDKSEFDLAYIELLKILITGQSM